MDACNAFLIRFLAFKATNAVLIESLTVPFRETSQSITVDDFHFDLISDLKGCLGSQCANECSDDGEDESDDEQEAAISEAEEWVTDNVSNAGGMEDTVALCLWLKGLKAGESDLAELLAMQLPVAV